jgi:hypothetical protein
MKKPPDPHYRHRFPAELISHAVWFYHVETIAHLRGEIVHLTCEGIFSSGPRVYHSMRTCGSGAPDRLGAASRRKS